VDKIIGDVEKTGIDCRERRLISKLYMDRSVKVWLDQKVIKSVKELDKDDVCHHFYSTYILNKLPRKLLKVLDTSKYEGK
jgi:hypothetical protein